MFRRFMTLFTLLLVFVAFARPAAGQVVGNGTLKGKAYFDLYKGLSDANEEMLTFSFRRIYFTYDFVLSDNIKGRFRTDATQESYVDDVDFAGQTFDTGSAFTRVFMKHAYVDWSVNDRFSLRAGQQGTILFGAIEDVWGYRHVEKTLEDLFKVRSSADFGFRGSVRAGDMFTINGMASNGEGYSKKDDSAYRKAFEVQGILTPIEGLTVSGHFGLNGYDEDGDPDTTGDQKDMTTMHLGVGYEGGNYAVGGSFANQGNYRGSTDVDARGFWAFGRYSMMGSPIGFVGAYYSFDPNTDVDDNETSYFLVGLDYSPGKGLNIIPNFRSTTVGDGDAVNSFLITFHWKW